MPTYTLGPEDGILAVRTSRTGAVAKAGHDLLIHVTEWSATLDTDAPSVTLDVKVVPADTDRFGRGHGFNTSPSDGAPAAIASATAKIRDKAQLLAGMALEAEPGSLTWSNGAWAAGENYKTIEDIALYAHGTGPLPPGVEGGLDAQTVYRD